jgi:hypothetical protein
MFLSVDEIMAVVYTGWICGGEFHCASRDSRQVVIDSPRRESAYLIYLSGIIRASR